MLDRVPAMNDGDGTGVAADDLDANGVVEDVKDARESNEDVEAGRDERGDAPARRTTPTPPTGTPPSPFLARSGDESK